MKALNIVAVLPTKLTILSIFSTFPGYFELVQFPYKNVTWDFIAQLVGSTIKVLREEPTFIIYHHKTFENIRQSKCQRMRPQMLHVFSLDHLSTNLMI